MKRSKNFAQTILSHILNAQSETTDETEKIQRLIRTINERIRPEKMIIAEEGNAGLTRLLFALHIISRDKSYPNEILPKQKEKVYLTA